MNIYAEGKEVLQSEFYNQPCLDLAKNLLGKLLCRKTQDGDVMKGRIVETESYLTGCRGKALLQECVGFKHFYSSVLNFLIKQVSSKCFL